MKTEIDRASMKKALVVDDHPDMLEILTWQLSTLGFSVITANNGIEGVEKAIKEIPQLILMDIMLPKMDGREATRQIRSNPKTKDIPILAASALFMASDRRSCIEAGCSDYISKPFDPKELREKIQNFFPTA
jgi:two-component system alkaline phosphatase synthesis response regulator PhoP